MCCLPPGGPAAAASGLSGKWRQFGRGVVGAAEFRPDAARAARGAAVRACVRQGAGTQPDEWGGELPLKRLGCLCRLCCPVRRGAKRGVRECHVESRSVTYATWATPTPRPLQQHWRAGQGWALVGPHAAHVAGRGGSWPRSAITPTRRPWSPATQLAGRCTGDSRFRVGLRKRPRFYLEAWTRSSYPDGDQSASRLRRALSRPSIPDADRKKLIGSSERKKRRESG